MLKRMAIWAQNFKIVKIVIFAISVLVMHTKNFKVFVVSAPNTTGQHAAQHHFFAYGRKIGPPFRLACFVYAGFRTIFSFLRQSAQKFNAAMQTMVMRFTFFAHCFMIAIRATIFGFVDPARNVCKLTPTFSAISFYLHSRMKRHARPAAKQSGIFSVIRHSKYCFTMNASFFMPNTGAFYATL